MQVALCSHFDVHNTTVLGSKHYIETVGLFMFQKLGVHIFVQSEMRVFGGIVDTEALKQHFGKKIMELEEEKRIVRVTYFII